MKSNLQTSIEGPTGIRNKADIALVYSAHWFLYTRHPCTPITIIREGRNELVGVFKNKETPFSRINKSSRISRCDCVSRAKGSIWGVTRRYFSTGADDRFIYLVRASWFGERERWKCGLLSGSFSSKEITTTCGRFWFAWREV